jgi:hypothetical protein
MRNEEWMSSKVDEEVSGPAWHCDVIHQGDHKCHRHAPLEQRKLQYAYRLLRPSNEYAHNNRGTVGDNIFYAACPRNIHGSDKK